MSGKRLKPVYVSFPEEYREWPDPIHAKAWKRVVESAKHERAVAALTLIGAAIRFAAVAAWHAALAAFVAVSLSVYLLPFLVVLGVVCAVVEWGMLGLLWTLR